MDAHIRKRGPLVVNIKTSTFSCGFRRCSWHTCSGTRGWDGTALPTPTIRLTGASGQRTSMQTSGNPSGGKCRRRSAQATGFHGTGPDLNTVHRRWLHPVSVRDVLAESERGETTLTRSQSGKRCPVLPPSAHRRMRVAHSDSKVAAATTAFVDTPAKPTDRPIGYSPTVLPGICAERPALVENLLALRQSPFCRRGGIEGSGRCGSGLRRRISHREKSVIKPLTGTERTAQKSLLLVSLHSIIRS